MVRRGTGNGGTSSSSVSKSFSGTITRSIKYSISATKARTQASYDSYSKARKKAIYDKIDGNTSETLNTTAAAGGDGGGDLTGGDVGDVNSMITDTHNNIGDSKTLYSRIQAKIGAKMTKNLNSSYEKIFALTRKDLENGLNTSDVESLQSFANKQQKYMDEMNDPTTSNVRRRELLITAKNDYKIALKNFDDSSFVKKLEKSEGISLERLKILKKIIPFLFMVGSLALLLHFLELIADELSGCYIYQGGEKSKLDDCSGWYKNNDSECSCGETIAAPGSSMNPNCSTSTLNGECLAPYCLGENCSEQPTNEKKPKCIFPDGNRHLCTSGDQTASGSVYYGYEKVTPFGLIADTPGMLSDLADTALDGISGIPEMLKNIMIWIGIAMLGVIGLIILYAIAKYLLKKYVTLPTQTDGQTDQSNQIN
jgi:hypothetical protein